MSEYDDIIHLPYSGVRLHRHMPLVDRAAQFAPFAALSGHGEMIDLTRQEEEASYRTVYGSFADEVGFSSPFPSSNDD